MTNDDNPNSVAPRARNVPTADELERKRQSRKRDYYGTEPLEYPELEAVAEFLATPRSVREIKTFKELAEHLGVSRMTVYRWTNDEDVLMRVRHLLAHSEFRGDLEIRRSWDRIVRALIRAAVNGDVKAANFCERRAWPKNPCL